MRNIRIHGAALAAVLLGGCATHTLLAQPPARPTGIGDTAVCTSGASILAVELCRTADLAKEYKAAADELSGGDTALTVFTVLPALVGAGWALWGNDDSVVAGAAVLTLLATGARTNLRLVDRVDILDDGIRSLRCVSERGTLFLTSTGDTRRTSIDTALRRLSAAITAVEAEGDTSEDVAKLLTDAKALQTSAQTALTAFNSIDSTVRLSRESIDNSIASRLRAKAPDIGALVTLIQGQIPAPPAAPGAAPAEERADVTEAAERDPVEDLKTAVAEMAILAPGQFATAHNEIISVCVAGAQS